MLLIFLKISKLHTLYLHCVCRFAYFDLNVSPFFFFAFCCWSQLECRLSCCCSRPLIFSERMRSTLSYFKRNFTFPFLFIKHPDALGGSHLQGSAAIRRERCKEACQQVSTSSDLPLVLLTDWIVFEVWARVAACLARPVPPLPLCERARRGHWAQLIFSLS